MPALSPILEVQPVRTIVRHSTTTIMERTASARAADGAKPEGRRESQALQPGPRAPEAAIDVNRLTEQVIQAIDRRIVAQRERLGRL
jgi:hypothetical protein